MDGCQPLGSGVLHGRTGTPQMQATRLQRGSLRPMSAPAPASPDIDTDSGGLSGAVCVSPLPWAPPKTGSTGAVAGRKALLAASTPPEPTPSRKGRLMKGVLGSGPGAGAGAGAAQDSTDQRDQRSGLGFTTGRRSDDAAPPAYKRSTRRAPTFGVNGSNFVETRAPHPEHLVYLSEATTADVPIPTARHAEIIPHVIGL